MEEKHNMKFLKKAALAAGLVLVSAVAAAAFPAVATNSTTVRAGPGNNYPVVDRLYPGERVDVVGRRGGWYDIAGTGWARAGNFDVLQRRSYPSSYYYDGRRDRWDYPRRNWNGHHHGGNKPPKWYREGSRVGSGGYGPRRPGDGGSSR
jgi:uncharacterized protein YraI